MLWQETKSSHLESQAQRRESNQKVERDYKLSNHDDADAIPLTGLHLHKVPHLSKESH